MLAKNETQKEGIPEQSEICLQYGMFYMSNVKKCRHVLSKKISKYIFSRWKGHSFAKNILVL